jgi:hypothetical protein
MKCKTYSVFVALLFHLSLFAQSEKPDLAPASEGVIRTISSTMSSSKNIESLLDAYKSLKNNKGFNENHESIKRLLLASMIDEMKWRFRVQLIDEGDKQIVKPIISVGCDKTRTFLGICWTAIPGQSFQLEKKSGSDWRLATKTPNFNGTTYWVEYKVIVGNMRLFRLRSAD